MTSLIIRRILLVHQTCTTYTVPDTVTLLLFIYFIYFKANHYEPITSLWLTIIVCRVERLTRHTGSIGRTYVAGKKRQIIIIIFPTVSVRNCRC